MRKVERPALTTSTSLDGGNGTMPLPPLKNAGTSYPRRSRAIEASESGGESLVKESKGEVAMSGDKGGGGGGGGLSGSGGKFLPKIRNH